MDIRQSMDCHIVVLMGGLSSEREVSFMSGEKAVDALRSKGYKVTPLDMQEDFVERLKEIKPDIVFNALHGTYGEDGCVPGILNILNIPYTHSGVLTSAIAMDKAMTKEILSTKGILFPEGVVVSRDDIINGKYLYLAENIVKKPYVIKPVSEGSSVGVFIVRDGKHPEFSEDDLPQTPDYLVETFIPGREISSAVLGNKVLGVIEIKPHEGFYDYTNKYTDNKTEHIVPAPVHQSIYDEACEIALKAHQILGCEGISRSDFRYDDSGGEPGTLYLLEINTHPGMTPLSLVPEIAEHAGISYTDLCDMLIKLVQCGK